MLTPCCRGARRWPGWAGDPGCPHVAHTAFLVPPSRALSTAPSGWQDTRCPVALLTKLKQATCVGDHLCSWGVFEKTVAARGLLGEAGMWGRTGSSPRVGWDHPEEALQPEQRGGEVGSCVTGWACHPTLGLSKQGGQSGPGLETQGKGKLPHWPREPRTDREERMETRGTTGHWSRWASGQGLSGRCGHGMDQSRAMVPVQGHSCSLDVTRWLPPGGLQKARGSDREEDSQDGMVATGGRWRGLGRGAALQLPSWALSQPALVQPNPDLLLPSY